MSTFGSEIKYEESSVGYNPLLECTIDLMQKTTTEGEINGLCSDPRHLHSFRTVPFLVLPFYKCVACGERLQPYVLGGSTSSSAAVNCMACGIFAHRRCAFSKHVQWSSKCASAIEKMDRVDATKPKHDQNNENLVARQEIMLPEDEGSRGSDDNASPPCIHQLSENDPRPIFRIPPLNSSEKKKDSNSFPSIRVSVSADDLMNDEKVVKDIQRTRANFPFLSSARLFESYNSCRKDPIPNLEIQKCNTWDGVVSSSKESCETHHEQHVEAVKSIEVPYSKDVVEEIAKSQSDNIIEKDEIRGTDDDDDDDDQGHANTSSGRDEATAPLHFASHGFRTVSNVLQENIVAHFNHPIPRDECTTNTEMSEKATDEHHAQVEVENDKSPVHSRSTHSDECYDARGRTDSDDNSEAHSEAHSLLETSEPPKERTVDKKRLGIATVAGTIVGGVVGVGLAGPLGGVIGIKCGQTAGMLGLLLEGSLTASALASGITAGMAAGQHIQERHETHVLAIGEGTKQRALLMVRPTIQPPEPFWDEIYRGAKLSYSGGSTGLVNRLLPNETQAAKRDRYEREIDIVETGEDELAIGDKVILLVSRILSNKESLPGHVYRKLIEAFRRRASEYDIHELFRKDVDALQGGTTTTPGTLSSSDAVDDDEGNDSDSIPLTQRRRRDSHAVIKYVTASLLLTRPGFGHSPSITEKTATAVESLVFGEIYDLVMEEFELEHDDSDNLLLEKIAKFERKFGHCDNTRTMATTSSDHHFDYKSFISEGAINALHCLTQAHSAVDKLRYCVIFLEEISEKFSESSVKSSMGADSLLKMVCQHILLAKVIGINSQVAFLEEFARDEQLLRGREGYALVTIQASLHFLNSSTNFERDIFYND